MVTTRTSGLAGASRRERAQLILVGAVAIAIIVMGLVVVFNTVLYTDNVASTGEVTEPDRAEQLNREINVSAKRLIKRVNAGPQWTEDEDSSPDSGDVKDAVLQNLSVYSDAISNSTVQQRQAVVSIEEGDDERRYAARIEDADGGNFTAPGDSGTRDWSVTTDSDTGVLVRDFDVILETDSLAPEGSGDEFHVVWNATNEERNYTVWMYEESGGDDVVIRTLVDGGASDDPRDYAAGTACTLGDSGDNDTVTINISNGVVQGYPGCSQILDVGDGVPSGAFSTADIFNGDNASGRYSMVAWRDDPDPGSYVSSDITSLPGPPIGDSETPHWSYAVWEMEVTVSYESRSLSYSNTFVIEVYNETR